MLTICHVLSSYGMGGQERVALDLAIQLRKGGHRVAAVSLAAPPEGPLAADFRAHDVDVHTIAKRPGFDATLFARLAALFRRIGARVVHTHNPQPLIYGAPAGKLARAAVVHTKHGANPDAARRVWMRRAAAACTDAYVAVSETTAKVARAHRDCAPEKLLVIPNGIDLGRFHPDAEARAEARAELGIPSEAWVVGTVGRVAPEKRHALLVDAMEPLLGERIRLVIVGDGPEAASLRDRVAASSQARFVHLPGARRDVPRLLAAFDVFAMTSSTEGLPLVLPEAMAATLPIVSTAVGGIPNVVEEGETGFLVRSGDTASLRDRLARLAEDHALAERLGRRAREVALARYGVERMARDYLRLYTSLVGA